MSLTVRQLALATLERQFLLERRRLDVRSGGSGWSHLAEGFTESRSERDPLRMGRRRSSAGQFVGLADPLVEDPGGKRAA